MTAYLAATFFALAIGLVMICIGIYELKTGKRPGSCIIGVIMLLVSSVFVLCVGMDITNGYYASERKFISLNTVYYVVGEVKDQGHWSDENNHLLVIREVYDKELNGTVRMGHPALVSFSEIPPPCFKKKSNSIAVYYEEVYVDGLSPEKSE